MTFLAAWARFFPALPPARRGDRLAGRRPPPAGDRAADRLLRQHPGAAARARGPAELPPADEAWPASGCSRPTTTRTCPSRSWSTRSSPSGRPATARSSRSPSCCTTPAPSGHDGAAAGAGRGQPAARACPRSTTRPPASTSPWCWSSSAKASAASSNTTPTSSTPPPSPAMPRASCSLLAGRGRGAGQADRRAAAAAGGRARAPAPPWPDLVVADPNATPSLAALFEEAAAAFPRSPGAHLRRRHAQLPPAGAAFGGARPGLARAWGRPRVAGGHRARPLARPGGGHPRHPAGRRRLRADRPQLADRPHGLHPGRQRRPPPAFPRRPRPAGRRDAAARSRVARSGSRGRGAGLPARPAPTSPT